MRVERISKRVSCNCRNSEHKKLRFWNADGTYIMGGTVLNSPRRSPSMLAEIFAGFVEDWKYRK
jgi:hypothetical protein